MEIIPELSQFPPLIWSPELMHIMSNRLRRIQIDPALVQKYRMVLVMPQNRVSSQENITFIKVNEYTCKGSNCSFLVLSPLAIEVNS